MDLEEKTRYVEGTGIYERVRFGADPNKNLCLMKLNGA